jgi:predicted AAA+ superfamily ATPase
MVLKREIESEFNKRSKVYKIIALVGPRQSGKTTFLKTHIQSLGGEYFSFDDPDIRMLFSEDIKKFEIQFIRKEKVTVLDEINYATNSGINLKYLADKDHLLWISSSSELLLSKQVLSHLVGRVSILKLYPLSLKEFLIAKEQREFNNSILERSVWEHLTFGGYPKVVLTEDVEMKRTILKDLYQTMILKDISNTFSISDISSLELFVKYLAINNGKMISYESISKNISLSFQTIKKYLDAMKKSYLIYELIPFYKNKLKEIVKQPKIYFIDCGMRNIIANQFESNPSGETFENYVLSELIKEGFVPKYWRTKGGAEVDFIIEHKGDIIPIEIKLNAHDKIESGLDSFIDSYKPKRAFIVSYNASAQEKEIRHKDCIINFVNVLNLVNSLKN